MRAVVVGFIRDARRMDEVVRQGDILDHASAVGPDMDPVLGALPIFEYCTVVPEPFEIAMQAVLTRSRVTSSPVTRVFPGTSTLRTTHVRAGVPQAGNANVFQLWPSCRTVVELSCRDPEAPVFVAAGLSARGPEERLESLFPRVGRVRTAGHAEHCGGGPAQLTMRSSQRLVRKRDVPSR